MTDIMKGHSRVYATDLVFVRHPVAEASSLEVRMLMETLMLGLRVLTKWMLNEDFKPLVNFGLHLYTKWYS